MVIPPVALQITNDKSVLLVSIESIKFPWLYEISIPFVCVDMAAVLVNKNQVTKK